MDSSEPRYQLSARTVPDSLAASFRWEPRGRFPEADHKLMDRLVSQGALTTEGFALYPPGHDRPQYVSHSGHYYELSREQAGTVERTHWILWFDLIEGDPPSDAEVFTSGLGTGTPTDLKVEYNLSAMDVYSVEDAAGQIPREFEFHDPAADPPGRRGYVFLRRDTAETALLPEPPFTHVAFETDDETRYAGAITEQATVELQQYDHQATQIADSAAAYAEYVRDQHLTATFNQQDLTRDQREILDTITAGGGRHNEQEPLSAAMKTILARLGIKGIEPPQSGGVEFSDEVYFRYQERNFSGQLEIFA